MALRGFINIKASDICAQTVLIDYVSISDPHPAMLCEGLQVLTHYCALSETKEALFVCGEKDGKMAHTHADRKAQAAYQH